MTGNHDDNAVPIIAHPGEVVLNEEQQRMLISNFENIPVSLPTPPQFVFASDSVDRLRTVSYTHLNGSRNPIRSSPATTAGPAGWHFTLSPCSGRPFP